MQDTHLPHLVTIISRVYLPRPNSGHPRIVIRPQQPPTTTQFIMQQFSYGRKGLPSELSAFNSPCYEHRRPGFWSVCPAHEYRLYNWHPSPSFMGHLSSTRFYLSMLSVRYNYEIGQLNFSIAYHIIEPARAIDCRYSYRSIERGDIQSVRGGRCCCRDTNHI